jgi:hypothetical protein
MTREREPDEQVVYEITVKGILDESWSEWLGGLAVASQESGQTLLSGPIRDQSSLHGLLNKIRDLGLPLLRVEKK